MTECNNYRTIALLNHMCKVLMMVMLERLKAQVEPHLAEEQTGFRRDRSTSQQILMLRLIAEKAHRKATPVYNCFVDFQKAFDSIKHEIIQTTFESYGVGKTLTTLLHRMLEQAKAAVRVRSELGAWFKVTVGVGKEIRYPRPVAQPPGGQGDASPHFFGTRPPLHARATALAMGWFPLTLETWLRPCPRPLLSRT
jgi:Reverse transcriptase (RNA-dependent DNA polymerase)